MFAFLFKFRPQDHQEHCNKQNEEKEVFKFLFLSPCYDISILYRWTTVEVVEQKKGR